jgi:hypothetical protein
MQTSVLLCYRNERKRAESFCASFRAEGEMEKNNKRRIAFGLEITIKDKKDFLPRIQFAFFVAGCMLKDSASSRASLWDFNARSFF